MANLTKDQKEDYRKWFKADGDAGFSPERNKKIVEDSIINYELKRQKQVMMFKEAMDERADAVSSLLKAIDRGKDTNALKYFGKTELARLRGEQILGEVKLRLAGMQRQSNAEKKYRN